MSAITNGRGRVETGVVCRRSRTPQPVCQYPRSVAKPDLIELSTDWDSALLVAGRYTGLGDSYLIHESKEVLAALLLIANKQGRDYRWVGDALLDYRFVLEPIQRAPRDGAQVLQDTPSDDMSNSDSTSSSGRTPCF
jgi:hypothetical protein